MISVNYMYDTLNNKEKNKEKSVFQNLTVKFDIHRMDPLML